MILPLLLLAPLPPQEVDSIILRGIEYSYVENYDSAKACFQRVISKVPDHPAGYFFMAGLYQLYMADFVTDTLTDTFKFYADTALAKANSKIALDSTDGWWYFYKGGVLAYYAFVKGKINILSALPLGLKATKYLKKAVARDSTIYDAYGGIGSFHFFQGMLPLMGKKKLQGLYEITLTMEKGHYNRLAAQNALCLLYIYDKQYDKAISLARDLVNRYPQSRTFLWSLCKAYQEKRDITNAVGAWERLLDMTLRDQPHTYYNILSICLALCKDYYLLGDKIEGTRVANIALMLDETKMTPKEKSLLRKIKILYKKLEKLQ